MKIPRDLSGHGLVQLLCRNWAYRVVHQEASHIVLETRCLSTNALSFLRTGSFVLEP